jgi:hypothetical protein
LSERKEWIRAAKEAADGKINGITCPVCRTLAMEAEWLLFIERQGGEFWLHCRNCGTENYVFMKSKPASIP